MRQLIFKLMFWSGLGPLLIAITQWQKKIPVFLFHRVDPSFDPLTEPLSPDSFEQIIIFLKRFYHIQRTSSLGVGTFNGSEALVQFDDATLDFAEHAHPILIKQKIPVALFIPVNAINEKSTIWNYLLFGIILESKTQTISIQSGSTLFNIQKDSKYFYRQVMELHSHLLQKTIHEAITIVKNNMEEFKEISFAPLCSWEDLSHLKKDGLVEFGSHTLNHAYLPSQSMRQAKEELSGSKLLLEKKMKISCEMMAYPNGGYSEKIITLAKSHYKMSFTVDESFVKLSELKNKMYYHRIPRFHVQDACPEELIFRIYGFHRFFIKIKNTILR